MRGFECTSCGTRRIRLRKNDRDPEPRGPYLRVECARCGLLHDVNPRTGDTIAYARTGHAKG